MQFAKVNVRVRDVERAVRYVSETLGGEVLSAPHEAPVGDIAIIRVHGLVMEIIQPTPGSVMAMTMERRGEGVDSIGFVTADVQADAGALEAQGANLVRPSGEGLAGTVWVHPRNPLSMSLELFVPGASGVFGGRP